MSALVLSSGSGSGQAAPQVKGGSALRDAIDSFRTALSPSQKSELERIKTVPDADAVLVFTAQLDQSRSGIKGQSIGSRLCTILQAVRDFSDVLDTYVSSHPEIAALVWGSVKLTVKIAMNIVSYYEALSEMFMDLGQRAPRFEQYQVLFPSSARVQIAVCEFHASIVHCCKHVVEAIQRPWHAQAYKALWTSFTQEFRPDMEEIRRRSKVVEQEIDLVRAQTEHEYHELQSIERVEAASSRKQLERLLSSMKKQPQKVDDFRIELAEQKMRARKQELLDGLSSYDYLTPLKQCRRKRTAGTARWLFDTPEFQRWLNGNSPALLWCSGKIGAGKTMLTSSLIDHILTAKTIPDIKVTFFFPRFDMDSSLKAETVLRSIARQMLTVESLTEELLEILEELHSPTSVEMAKLVQVTAKALTSFRAVYIVIDGLDECDKSDRLDLMHAISSLVSSTSCIKVFIASRDQGTSIVPSKGFPDTEFVSMNCEAAKLDVTAFVDNEIQRLVKTGDLKVRDATIQDEIRSQLTKHSDGMILWIVLQLKEICSQGCDEDIRIAVKSENLPKDLSTLFHRVLLRIASEGNGKMVQKIIPWLVAAKRPLSLQEIEESVYIEILQVATIAGRRLNGIDNIATWFGGLIEVDEEKKSVHFIHASVRQFLIGPPSKTNTKDYHADINHADHMMGEICVTYLHFRDLQGILSRRPKPLPPIAPEDLAKGALGHRWNSASTKMMRTARPITKSKSSPPDIDRTLIKLRIEDRSEDEPTKHHFLSYASSQWLRHTANFEPERSRTWYLWKQMTMNGHRLALSPVSHQPYTSPDRELVKWAIEQDQLALLRLLLVEHQHPNITLDEILRDAAAHGKVGPINIILSVPEASTELTASDMVQACNTAAGTGCLEAFQAFLAKTPPESYIQVARESLISAAAGGHAEVIEFIVTKKELDDYINSSTGEQALLAAATAGYFQEIEYLLPGWDVVGEPFDIIYQFILAAARGDQLRVIDYLLLKADMQKNEDRIAEILIAMGFSSPISAFNHILSYLEYQLPPAVLERGFKEAAIGGNLDVVRVYLDIASQGRTQGSGPRRNYQLRQEILDSGFIEAATGGNVDLVELLLAEGARMGAQKTNLDPRWHMDIINARTVASASIMRSIHFYEPNIRQVPGPVNWTALLGAAIKGRVEVVRFLIGKDGMVETNTVPLVEGALSVLQAAASANQVETVKLLVSLGADIGLLPARDSGLSAMQAAAAEGQMETVQTLISLGASVNGPAAVQFGLTALQAASAGGHVEVVRELLRFGALVNADPAANHGLTALQAAAANGHTDVMRVLISAGADADAKPARVGGLTAMQAAAVCGHVSAIFMLLGVGAEEKASLGYPVSSSALELALQRDHFHILRLLRQPDLRDECIVVETKITVKYT